MAMVEDVVPGLLKQINTDFERGQLSSSTIKGLLDKLGQKQANYLDANDYAIEIGEILSKVLRSSLSNDTLPDGKMYYNIANRLLNETLGRNYELVSDYASEVQKNLNQKAKIGLAVQHPELNQDRIDGLVNRLSSEESFDKVSWLLGEPIVNFTQSIVDDSIRKNAEFHAKAGLSPKIVRRESGNCCDWCKEVAGTYTYPKVPKNVYRRHQRCRCTVDYHPGNGKKQNVWTKKWSEDKRKSEIKHRKQIGLPDNDKPYSSVKKEWLKHSGNGSVSDMVYWEHEGIKYHVDGKHIALDYSAKEKEVAEWLAKKFGVNVQIVPKVNYPLGIPTPDYLINSSRFDLKEIKGAGKNVVDNNMRKSKKQANNFVLELLNSDISNEEVLRQLENIYKSGRREVNTVVIKKGDALIDIIKKRK
jgi:hypothetical protein